MIQLLPKELRPPVPESAAKSVSTSRHRTMPFGVLIAAVVVIGIAVGFYLFRSSVAILWQRYFGSTVDLGGGVTNSTTRLPAASDPQRIFVKTVLSRAIDAQTGIATDPVEKFTAQDTRYYAIVELVAATQGLQAEARWYKDDQFQANFTLQPTSRFATFWVDVATRTPEQRVGRYRVEIFLNESLVNTTEFTVQ